MKRTRMEKVRLSFVLVAVCLFFSVVTLRLVHLQIILNPEYSKIVQRQSSGTVNIPAPRGIIYDRYGKVVANNVTRSSLYSYAVNNRELVRVGRYLDSLLNLKSGTSQSRYNLKVRRFRWIERRINDKLANQIESTAPKGLYLRAETQRDYPQGLVGKQILGFTNIDNKGQSGFELSCDSLLAGRLGKADTRRDGKRNLYRVKESALIKPEPGKSAVLTVDWRLQEILEDELRSSVEQYNALTGQGAFVDCQTGEILAMAHYDPSEKHPQRPVKLRTVTDQFEPGSIFKAITAAAVLDAGFVNFSDTTYCEMGKWKIGRRTLHDDKEHGGLTFREVIELSSNIGVAKHAIKLGGDRLYQKALDFGFGQHLNTGLGGETRGRVYCPERWSDFTVASLAMGHSVAVNSLQMAMAFAAIANGGELLKPSLLMCSVTEKGNLSDRCEPTVIRRVMKKNSADSLQTFLRGVVKHGTATKVNSPTVAIAGKTGTAEIVRSDGRGYFKNKFMASFAGFFPYEEPKIAGIVVLREPKPIHYGGYTAGPIFRRIAESYMVINPDLFATGSQTMTANSVTNKQTVEVPDFVGRPLEIACSLAKRRGIELRRNTDKGIVVWQYPPADRLVFRSDEVLVVVETAADTVTRMPDLCGLSIRKASAFLGFIGIDNKINGKGYVVKQSILPGVKISKHSKCRLECLPG
ncbi:MAG: penicillin-binding transpeptidase domain-containing protein [candidate division Zixibacteria bacterium]|nr:penicillin-binding transpeptidase domain-containing protein [candidate division Zixibacteria bacterium]